MERVTINPVDVRAAQQARADAEAAVDVGGGSGPDGGAAGFAVAFTGVADGFVTRADGSVAE